MGPNATRSLIADQLKSMGLSVLLALAGTAGTAYYVDSTNTNASNSNTGQGTFTKGNQGPFATLAYAATAVTAARGDVIVVMPNHAEALTGAASIALSKSGVNIMGVGNGYQRPTFTWTTAIGAQMTITAANVRISNCIFVCGFDAITAMISITASDVTIEDCLFVIAGTIAGIDSTFGAVLGVLTAASAHRLTIQRCRFTGPATSTGTTTTACIKHEVGVDYVIRDCFFVGKMTQAILNATTILRGLIKACDFHIYTGTKAIAMAAASTGIIEQCNCVVASGGTPMVGTVMSYVDNHYTTEGIGVNAGTALTF